MQTKFVEFQWILPKTNDNSNETKILRTLNESSNCLLFVTPQNLLVLDESLSETRMKFPCLPWIFVTALQVFGRVLWNFGKTSRIYRSILFEFSLVRFELLNSTTTLNENKWTQSVILFGALFAWFHLLEYNWIQEMNSWIKLTLIPTYVNQTPPSMYISIPMVIKETILICFQQNPARERSFILFIHWFQCSGLHGTQSLCGRQMLLLTWQQSNYQK